MTSRRTTISGAVSARSSITRRTIMFRNSLTAVVFCALWWSLDLQPSAVSARLAIETAANGDKYKVAEYNTKLTIACDVDADLAEADDPAYTWKWFKGDNRSVNQITDDFDRVYQVDVSENTLTFNRFIGSNAGRYTCKLFDDNDAFVDAKVIYVALKPYVKLPKTATFNEGERMELECIVHGVPTPEISWRFENTTLVPSGRVSFLPDVITNISNAVLVLDPIAAENSGNFYCAGKSAVVAKPVISNPTSVLVKETTTRMTAAVQDQAEWLVAVDLAERRAVAAERRAISAEQRAAVAEQRAAAAERRAAVTEQRAESAELRATVSEKRATLSEQRAVMAEQRQKNGQ